MAITVSLYKCSSDNRVIDKKLTSVKTGITCQFKEDNSITQPHVVIPYFDGYKDVNYFYIPSNGRYYYLEDTIQRIGNLLEFRGNTDVLMSFKNGINNIRGYVSRSTDGGNRLLADPMAPIASGNDYETISFPNKLSIESQQKVLIVAG